MHTSLPQVLIVDDDQALCALLIQYLATQAIHAQAVHNAQQALNLLKHQSYDVLILDIMMPGMDGLELLKTLRQSYATPVIMLTGKGDDIDRIIGLELGADDYMGKPCNPRELSARIKAILRRSQLSLSTQPEDSPREALSLKHLHLDYGALEVVDTRNQQRLNLTGVEFRVLYYLLEHSGQTVSKETLCENVLQRKLDSYDRSIDVHISRIRNKLAQADINDSIKTLRGAGYQLASLDN